MGHDHRPRLLEARRRPPRRHRHGHRRGVPGRDAARHRCGRARPHRFPRRPGRAGRARRRHGRRGRGRHLGDPRLGRARRGRGRGGLAGAKLAQGGRLLVQSGRSLRAAEGFMATLGKIGSGGWGNIAKIPSGMANSMRGLAMAGRGWVHVATGTALDFTGTVTGVGLAAGSNANDSRWTDGDWNVSDIPVVGPIAGFAAYEPPDDEPATLAPGPLGTRFDPAARSPRPATASAGIWASRTSGPPHDAEPRRGGGRPAGALRVPLHRSRRVRAASRPRRRRRLVRVAGPAGPRRRRDAPGRGRAAAARRPAGAVPRRGGDGRHDRAVPGHRGHRGRGAPVDGAAGGDRPAERTPRPAADRRGHLPGQGAAVLLRGGRPA